MIRPPAAAPPPRARANADAREHATNDTNTSRYTTAPSIIEPEQVPAGSRFRGYRDFDVQDLIITAFNTRYRLARYETPGGQFLVGKLPEHLNHGHFGPTLEAFIVHQYHHQRVTQPLLLEQLRRSAQPHPHRASRIVPLREGPDPASRPRLQRLCPRRRHWRTSSWKERLLHPHRQRTLRLLPIH